MKTNKNIAKKLMSGLLLIALLVSSMPGAVLTSHAATASVSYIQRSWNASSKTVSSTRKSAQATTVTAGDSSWGQEGEVTYYMVNSAVTSTQNQIKVYGEVHLILNQKFSVAGTIFVQENAALHIHGAANAQDATIEVKDIWSDGTVVAIHGGTVTTSQTEGSTRRGIGIYNGNFYLYSGTVNGTIGKSATGKAGGSILIYGGTVNANTSGTQGLIAADNGSYESIEIYNATIKGNRTSSQSCNDALIGGEDIGKIIIHNSNVHVVYDGNETGSGNSTHGIGGGDAQSRLSEITITNSTIDVWGGSRGSGIGGFVDTITLKDSTILAYAGEHSKPIGTGIGGSYCNQILIDGGYVMTSTADEEAAWKGKGYYAKNITIKKGTVDAREGVHLNGGNMVITGGNVLGTVNGATPINNDGTTLYSRQITLSGAADKTAVSAIAGVPGYYDLTDMRTIGSEICVWVPKEDVPSVVSLGNDQYGGAMTGGATNSTATFNKLHTCTDSDDDGLCNQCEELMPPSMENGFYLIYDLEDYQYFKKMVEGTLKSGLANRKANAKLMANIDIGGTMIGTATFPYGGVFDGNFHTLTVNIVYESVRDGSDPIAPFVYADGATFKKLTMAGSIYVNHARWTMRTKDIGGFVAITKGNPVTFEQCMNKAHVKANNYNGPIVNLGGFVGMNYTTLTFNNCASLGRITTSRSAGGSGFVGNSDTTSPVYVNDSYIYLTMDVQGNNNDYNSYFCRNQDYTFLSNTYLCITAQKYTDNSGWINIHNRNNKDGPNDMTSVTAAQVNNGTVAYNLNKGNADGIWKQTLTGDNPDQYPVFSGANVVSNITSGGYDNHAHNPKHELATVNVENDSVRVTCAGCAPDGIYITVSIQDGTTYAKYGQAPEASITHPNLANFYYKQGSTILTQAPTKAGNYTVNFEYGGIEVSVPYSILPRSIEMATVTSNGDLPYTGQEQSASFKVDDYGTVRLQEGVDYTLSNHKQTNVGTYEVTITGIGNYTGTQTATFSIAPASNSWITAPSLEDWTYGEEPKQPIYEAKYGTVAIRYTGETNGGEEYDSDKIPTQAGQYQASFTVNGENYTSLSSTVSFTIDKAALTVTADDKTIIYGDKAPNYTVGYEGFVNGDDKEDLGGTLVTDCTYSQFDDKGTYSIIPSGYTSDNYEIAYKNGTLTVNPKPITVTIDDKSSVYGHDIVTLTAKTDGIVNNDQNVYSLSTTATKTSDVSEYDITGTTLDDNYDITFVDGKYTITKAVATVATAPAAKQGLVYNKAAQELVSVGTAVGGEMQYSLDGMNYVSSVPVGTDAGTYTVYYKVFGDSNHNDNEAATLTVTIDKKTVDLSGVKWNYTEAFKYDGKTHGVAVDESTMPEGASVSNYTGHSGIETGKRQAAVAIIYNDNYKGEATLFLDWEIVNNWTPIEYIVSTPNNNGWVNKDFVITADNGYKVSLTNTADGTWEDSFTYTNETADGSVTFYLKNMDDGTISLAKTVTYKLDKTLPIGKVSFDERNGWEKFLNIITFDLFYKDEVTVKVDYTDQLSDVASVEYYASSEEMTLDRVERINEWTAYNYNDGVAVKIDEDGKQFVYYVRIIDYAGNVTYLSTNGAKYDVTAPVISDIENDKTYHTTQRFTVQENNLESVTVNGEESVEFVLDGNIDKEYVVVATDKAGNSTTVTITMKLVSDIDSSTDGITEDNVTSDDKETVQSVIDEVNELLDDEDVTDDEKAELEEIKGDAEKLIEKIEEAKKATETENTGKVEDVTPENVTPENKTDLEKAKEDLEKALTDNDGNYTEEEKKDIENEIKRIDDALEIIGNVEEVEELIGKLPENIKKSDEAAIKAADDAYNALSDYEKTLVDKNTKKALDNAKAALAELNKPADPDSPATGDNGNLWLWFALLFVSGAGIFGMPLVVIFIQSVQKSRKNLEK